MKGRLKLKIEICLRTKVSYERYKRPAELQPHCSQSAGFVLKHKKYSAFYDWTPWIFISMESPILSYSNGIPNRYNIVLFSRIFHYTISKKKYAS